MKGTHFVALSLFLPAALAISSPSIPPIIVTEVVNTVTVSDSLADAGQPLAAHQGVLGGKFLRTGADSRSHIDLGNGEFGQGDMHEFHGVFTFMVGGCKR